MRIVVSQASLRGFLRGIQRALFLCAAVTLGYCVFVAVDGWLFQKRERRQLEQVLREREPAHSSATSNGAAISGLIGLMEVPRLGVSAILMEGSDALTLRRAVGHIAGTALPGQPGNVGIAGHRDTYFRPLRNIRKNDVVTLRTLLGVYRYRVISTRVTNPGDVAVLDTTANESLTLVTCYPFYVLGAAPSRFIVRAERMVETKSGL